MGFANKTTYSSSYFNSTYTLTFPFTCNFNGIPNINIFCTSFNTANIDSYNKSSSSIIQSIPVIYGSSQILYQKSYDFAFTILQDEIDYLEISIKDDLENFINFNNCHWNLCLQFTTIKDIDRLVHEKTFDRILSYSKQGRLSNESSDSNSDSGEN